MIRRTIASFALASTVLFAALPAEAASKKTATPKRSVANYCKSAKSWLAFENQTLESGPYDIAWFRTSKTLMQRLYDTAPTAIKADTAGLGAWLVITRRDIAQASGTLSEADLEGLITDAKVLNFDTVISSRNAVGAYAKKNCKVDVLAPFVAVAKGFE